MAADAKKEVVLIVLPEVTDVEAAADVAENIRAALKKGNGVALDGSEIRHIATPGVQMLLSAYAYHAAHDGAITLSGLSDAAMRSAEILGADRELHQWREETA